MLQMKKLDVAELERATYEQAAVDPYWLAEVMPCTSVMRMRKKMGVTSTSLAVNRRSATAFSHQS